jgi:integrase
MVGANAPATHWSTLTGRSLLTLQLDPTRMPPMARGGVAMTTRVGHRRALNKLVELAQADELPVYLLDAPLPIVLLELINRRRRGKEWRWSTTVTALAQLQGALAQLPLYGTIGGRAMAIPLRHDVAWAQAMRAAKRKANEQKGQQPKAATNADITQVLHHQTIGRSTKAAILLSWLVAARCGDTLQLRRSDVVLTASGSLQVTWTRGKTVACRGPYTVTSQVPAQWRQILQETLDGAGTPTAKVFPDVNGRAIKLALRASGNTALEQRSIRRGSLQQLAAMNVKTEVLLRFSGHATERMLFRYLGHGRHARVEQGSMLQAAMTAFG